VTGLRSSLHDLDAAHTGAVTAINKRLERIEVMVGLTTDMTSSVSDPARKGPARRDRRQAGEESSRRRRHPMARRQRVPRPHAPATSRVPSAGTCSTSSR
jgi:hypothetical protein